MSLQRNKAQTHKASSSGHETTLPGQDVAPQSRSHGTCTFLRDTDPSLGNVQEPRAKRSPSGHVVPLFTPKRMQLNHSQKKFWILFFSFFLKINFFS